MKMYTSPAQLNTSAAEAKQPMQGFRTFEDARPSADGPCTMAPHAPELSNIHERLLILATTLSESSHSLDIAIDYVFGSAAVADGNPCAPRCPGMLGTLHDALDRIDEIACTLRGQSQRIGRL